MLYYLHNIEAKVTCKVYDKDIQLTKILIKKKKPDVW